MIKWIANHKLFTIITSVILVLCIIISLSYFKGNGFVGDLLQRGNAQVSEPVTDAANGVRKGIGGIFGFKKVVKENEALKEEVKKLEREIIALRLTEEELSDLNELVGALNYIEDPGNQSHVAAKIIAVDNSSIFNIFTINAGTESGVREDCVVISDEGLVGRVSEAGEGYAKVVSVIDEGANISFQVLRDMNILGVVSGNGNGGLDGYAFEGDAGIVEGDMLISTGIGIYPEGIQIGKVTKVEYNSDVQLLTVKAEPTVNFKNIRKVVVLL